MPTSGDGILTAEFDPTRALVMLTVDGGMWPSPVASITMTRATVGAASEPVRGLDERTTVAGGWWLGSDQEMPLDAEVTYTVTGYSAAGAVVRSTAVTVSTVGAAWGLWLKIAGRPDWAVRCGWGGISDRTTATQGGVYEVIGGDAVGQSSGVLGERFTATVTTRTPVQAAALRRLLTQPGRTLLLQTGQPEEIASGWYFVETHAETNPTQLRSDHQPLRQFALQVVRVAAPAGGGGAFAGATYRSVQARHATYADVLAAGTYADIARGA